MGQFSLDVSAFVKRAGDKADLVVRKISLDMFRRIILRSPVDTGRFRGNWQCTIGNVANGTLMLNDKTGQATISRMTATALQLKAGQTIFLVNNLVYGPALEFGHSKQAPEGMVRITIAEFQQVIKQAVGQ